MSAPRVIGVDLGGTKISSGLVERDGTVSARRERVTPATSQEVLLAALAGEVEALLDAEPAALGIAIPSRFDRHTGRAVGSVNVPLADVDVAGLLRSRFGLPVGVENDANAAALAEWRLGAGRGSADLVMLTLGTGVGGGLVLGGRLYRGWAELGHMVVVAGGPPCFGSCGGHGHLEALASGQAVDRLAGTELGDGATAQDLIDAARAGDGRAAELLGGVGRLLGAGIGSLINVFDPDVVVVGGGFGASAGELLLAPAREAARAEALAPAAERVCIVCAELGSAAGLAGAGLVGFEALDGER